VIQYNLKPILFLAIKWEYGVYLFRFSSGQCSAFSSPASSYKDLTTSQEPQLSCNTSTVSSCTTVNFNTASPTSFPTSANWASLQDTWKRQKDNYYVSPTKTGLLKHMQYVSLSRIIWNQDSQNQATIVHIQIDSNGPRCSTYTPKFHLFLHLNKRQHCYVRSCRK